VRSLSSERGEPAWDWPALRERCLREAARVLADPIEAEDVVQEALIRAWRRKDSCQAETRLPWLLTITRREAHRWRGAPRGRREPLLDDGELERLRGVAPLVDDDTALEHLAVQEALAELSPEERRLVHLRYDEDLTQADIASFLDIPEGTVKVRLHRLRIRLKEELTA
jgi:RNA polymerase sigma-70 factor (ECF subfamily)